MATKLEQAARQIIVDWDSGIHLYEAITALREALKPTREGKYYYKDNACTADNADSPDCICWHDEALAEQAEQEPEAWGCRFQDGSIHDCICPEAHAECEGDYNIPLYAAPVRTKDLTDEEIDRALDAANVPELPAGYESIELEIARAVIAADREKNK